MKILKGPSDEETFEMLSEHDTFEQIKICEENLLNQKFYPSELEINNAFKTLGLRQLIAKSIEVNRFDYFKLVIDHGVSFSTIIVSCNKDLISIKNYIILHHRISMIKYYLEKHNFKNINDPIHDNDTFLILAIHRFRSYKQNDENGINFVRYLVEHGADVNHIGNSGYTPLYLACCRGYRDIIKYLILQGADINYKRVGRTVFDCLTDKNLLSFINEIIELKETC
jgi:ankyrin repeat protein